MNAPHRFDPADLVKSGPSGLGATLAHPDFDALVVQPGFLDQLPALLAKHLVIRIDAPPFAAESLAKVQAMLGVSSASKGPRLAGFEHIIEFNSPANPAADPQKDADVAQILHHDSAGLAEPPRYAVVNTKSIPGKPALQSWVDMQAVYRDLPAATRSRINGLNVLHPSFPEMVSTRVHRDVKELPANVRDYGQLHPLVVRNKATGLPALFLSVRRDAKIPGLVDAEARALLTELWERVESSPHRWQSPAKGNDIFIWDNIATVHDRPPFSSAEPRRIWFANLGPERLLPAFAA